MNEHEKTVIVTCSRQKAEAINKLAVEGLFAGRRPIATLEGEIDINPASYDEGGFREDRAIATPDPK